MAGTPFPTLIVDNVAKNGIMSVKEVDAVNPNVNNIGKIDISKFDSIVDGKIITDEVIITDDRISHIIERRGEEFYNKYSDCFAEILDKPDYIFKDDKPNTVLVSRKYVEEGKNINIVLRVVVEGDDPEYKNSILTAIPENEKRFMQRLRNNTPSYSGTIDKNE